MGGRTSSVLSEVAQAVAESCHPSPCCFSGRRETCWGFEKGDGHLLFCRACQPKPSLCRYLYAFQQEHKYLRDSCRPVLCQGRFSLLCDIPYQYRCEMRLLILAVFALFSVARCEEGARLLASKSLLNGYAVEDGTLQYIIYNTKSEAFLPSLSLLDALDTELSDDSFPPWEDFGIVSAMFNVKWLQIARVSNVSHAVVLRPLEAAYFNFASATIAYLARGVGFMSAPGQGGILAQRESDRRFSPHVLDWAAFGAMTLPSAGMLLLRYSSKSKYDTRKTKKK
ncbi:translocon-associated protein subunit beta-like [Gymnogyps californianus]|uniref:translocon-associated protein subunit beta-like n=1 Tax=Gymnogyps californianus TaxID=33616 RepID=UPI0021C9A523|nr:translocon-associated protein subunit beta-like [Gymnogyps californianus]